MFSVKNLQINRGRTTAATQGKDTSVIHTYIDENSTVANIRLYFPPFLDQGEAQDDILLTDYMFVTGSDTAIMARILSLDPFTMDIDLFSGAAGLSVGAPIPPVDTNAAKITLGILQMEIADQTHPGIMTALPQDFGGEKTFHANVNIQDPPNGLIITKTMGNFGVDLVTSDLNAVTGFLIDDTAFPGASFGMVYKRAGFISADPELSVLSGANARITFNETSGTVTINNKIITDFLDAGVGNALSIGGTNATVINLGTNTTLPFDKELFTNAINGVTAVPLVIGATNSTAIHLQQDTTIVAGKKVLTNLIDSITAVPLEIGGTNASVISLLETTEIPAGKQLHTNHIDSITAAPLIVGDTNTTEVVMNKGVKFATAGGTPSLLNDYEEYDHVTTFTNNTETSASITIRFIRIGDAVIATIKNAASVPGQVAPAASFSSNTALPARFRPPINILNSSFIVSNNTLPSGGATVVTSSGIIQIFNNADFVTAFTAGVSNGFFPGSLPPYTLN